jgi:hypothetical protein
VWALNIDLVQCAEVWDVVGADVVTKAFEALTVACVDVQDVAKSGRVTWGVEPG